MTTTKAKTKKGFNSIQDKIFKIVNETPGIRYRELLRTTGMSNGVLSYHLTFLNNSRKIRVNKINNRVTTYFSRDVSPLESKVIGLLHQSTTRKIIIYILEHGPCEFNDIVNYTKKAPSTVSWHLTKIKDGNFIKVKQNQYNYYYYDTTNNNQKVIYQLWTDGKRSFVVKKKEDEKEDSQFEYSDSQEPEKYSKLIDSKMYYDGSITEELVQD